ncbi:hypothetical protein [Zobellia russellii]|uniref:hypothetical protein n=1 Tax=Zobellia russellii TaxID=248907 RepID=UPI0037DD91AE
MKIEHISDRVYQLIQLADKVILTKRYGEYDVETVDLELFKEFRASTLSFFKNVFGEQHPFYKEFDKNVRDTYIYHTEEGRGILKAAKQEVDGGWMFTVKGLVSAEIFSDFLEMADHLLKEGYKDPSAVMIGSVLEEHLRQLCLKNSIPIEKRINEGKPMPKKADLLNSELASASIYNKLDQKSITSWLDLRNKAAHGKYEEYSKEQVELMFNGVSNFMTRVNV